MKLFDFLVQEEKETSEFMAKMANGEEAHLSDNSHLHVIGTCSSCRYLDRGYCTNYDTQDSLGIIDLKPLGNFGCIKWDGK